MKTSAKILETLFMMEAGSADFQMEKAVQPK